MTGPEKYAALCGRLCAVDDVLEAADEIDQLEGHLGELWTIMTDAERLAARKLTYSVPETSPTPYEPSPQESSGDGNN